MNPVRHTLRLLAVLMLLAGFGAAPVTAQESVRIEVVLVLAGDGDSGIDPALRAHAPTLQRLFRFQSYRRAGGRTVEFALPGEARVALAEGQSLTLRSAEAEPGPGVRVDLEWDRGRTRLLHTRLQLRPGSPAVLGGPRGGEGTWLLLLQLK